MTRLHKTATVLALATMFCPSAAFSLDPEDEIEVRHRKLKALGIPGEARHSATIELPDDLEGLIALALGRNPGLRAQFERVKQKLHQAKIVGSLADPKLTFGVFLEKVETRVGPQEFLTAADRLVRGEPTEVPIEKEWKPELTAESLIRWQPDIDLEETSLRAINLERGSMPGRGSK